MTQGSTKGVPIDTDPTLALNSNQVVPSQAALVTYIAAQVGTKVGTVTGTANRITSSGGTSPAIDISASYVGQSSITTLGTITTGVWTGTSVALANGGTSAALTASNGGILYSTASAAAILAGTATAGQIVRSGASTAPTWSTATYPATAGSAGNVLKSDGTNWTSDLPPGAAWTLITQTSISGNPVAVSFTSGLTSYNELMMIWTGVTQNGNSLYQVGFSTNGGSTYAVTATNQICQGSNIVTGGGNAAGPIYISINSAFGGTLSGYCWLWNPNLTTNRPFTSILTNNSSSTVCFSGQGILQSTAQINAIKFNKDASTFLAGTVSLYGR